MNPPTCDLAPSSKYAIDFGIHFSGLRASRVLSQRETFGDEPSAGPGGISDFAVFI